MADIDTAEHHSPYCSVNNPFAGPEGGGGACDCLVAENDSLRARNEWLAERYNAVVVAQNEHCKDCCCARSWAALGVSEYTGMSIPEHIDSLRAQLQAANERADAAVELLVGWCLAIELGGTGWDDWDYWYKLASYNHKGPLRDALDAEFAKQRAALEQEQ